MMTPVKHEALGGWQLTRLWTSSTYICFALTGQKGQEGETEGQEAATAGQTAWKTAWQWAARPCMIVQGVLNRFFEATSLATPVSQIWLVHLIAG